MTFQEETVDKWWADAKPLIYDHWQELGLDTDLKGDIAVDLLRQLEKAGKWVTLTVRTDAGELAGYAVALLNQHLHYFSSGPMFLVDMYYIRPQYRRGTGLQMLKFMEEVARRYGAIKIYLSCKVHKDHTKLFTALGYRLSDYAFTKRIG